MILLLLRLLLALLSFGLVPHGVNSSPTFGNLIPPQLRSLLFPQYKPTSQGNATEGKPPVRDPNVILDPRFNDYVAERYQTADKLENKQSWPESKVRPGLRSNKQESETTSQKLSNKDFDEVTPHCLERDVDLSILEELSVYKQKEVRELIQKLDGIEGNERPVAEEELPNCIEKDSDVAKFKKLSVNSQNSVKKFIRRNFLDQSNPTPKVDKKEPGQVGAPMPGTVTEVMVKENDTVVKGAPLVYLSVMNMEMLIRAPMAGTVSSINVSIGQKVEPGDLILTITV